MYLVYLNLFWGTLIIIMSSIDLATGFKIGMYLLNKEKHFSVINRYDTSFQWIANW